MAKRKVITIVLRKPAWEMLQKCGYVYFMLDGKTYKIDKRDQQHKVDVKIKKYKQLIDALQNKLKEAEEGNGKPN